MTNPFRFIAPMPSPVGQAADWLDAVRHIEDLGFDAISVSEHLSGGWRLEATTAMMAILGATTRLRVASLVLVNDFRNPVLLHKVAASLDYLGGGRVVLGLGAGWLEPDYTAAGFPFAPPAERIDRLEEAVIIIKGLFGSPSFSYDGRFYHISRAEGLPRPTQMPHPPILIGGGGPRILRVAARHADIIGVHARLDAPEIGPAAAHDLSDDAIAAKVALVHDALRAAGRAPESVELQLTIYECSITDLPGSHRSAGSGFPRFLRADPGLLQTSPAVLIGGLSSCVERLQHLRERFGFNVIKLAAPPDDVAPLVRLLAGT